MYEVSDFLLPSTKFVILGLLSKCSISVYRSLDMDSADRKPQAQRHAEKLPEVTGTSRWKVMGLGFL